MRCPSCRSTSFKDLTGAQRMVVAGRTFEANLPKLQCRACRTQIIHTDVVKAFEWEIAQVLARNGPVSAASFRFLRRQLGLTHEALADLLGVAADGTISRWENGHVEIARATWFALASLVLDQAEGHTAVRDRLRALRRPPPKAIVRLDRSRGTSRRPKLR